MNFVLRIKKRANSEWITLFVLAMPFLFGLLIDLIGLPTLVKYVIDIAWIVLLGALILNRFMTANRESKKILGFIAIFFCITLVGFIINLKSPLYYLWGFRNNFRFFIFLLSCISFLDFENLDGYLKIFDKLFYLNFAVSLIQYFGFGIKRDRLGGIFGNAEGSNGFTIIFFSIIIAKSILSYLNNKEKFYLLFIKCLMAIIVSALAELKFFYFLFIVIVAIAVLVTEFTFKKLSLIILSVVGVILGITILMQIFPTWANWFTIDRIVETALSTEGYTGAGDMNRLTSVPMSWNMFLTSWPKRLLGLGLGNCDTSAFSFLTTPFSKSNGYLHYNWFSTSFMLLETGLIGLLTYFSFFVLIYSWAGKRLKNGKGEALHCQLAKVIAVVALILVVYNQSMRTEAAYMMFFVFSLPFINKKTEQL